MSSDRFNLVAIGGGAAGLVTSYIGAAVKAKVALIEEHKMGGDCLNYGCVPSKALIRSARYVHDLRRHAEFGVSQVDFQVSFPEIMARVKAKIAAIEPHDSVERYEGMGVRCFSERAEILDPHHVRVGQRVLRTKNIVLAMGAAPFIPSIHGLEEIDYLTSENLWDLQELPRRLVVLGGGPIGCEMVQAFQRLGSQVTQVEMLPRILAREDEDVAQWMTDRLSHEGATILTDSKATRVYQEGGESFLEIETAQGKKQVPFDKLLVAVGRKARTKGVDWGKLGIELNPNGTIKVDKFLRTTGPKNIYACGDVAGPYQFTHTAAHMAWFCAVNALFSPFKKFPVDYRVISWVTFTDPEIAQVGLNESRAIEQNIPYELTTYGMDDLDRAITESEDHGFIKVLTVPGKDKILGATIVSHMAGELIGEFVTAMKYGIGLGKILGTIHAYPTFIEANKYAAGNWKKAHAPAWALRLLERYHQLRL